MEKIIEDRIMDCLKIINGFHDMHGRVEIWKIKDIFAREFTELKDEINKL
jgi:hypothetical protein